MDALTTLMPAVPAALWWTLSILLVLTGLAGTVLPVLPGTLLVLAGLLLGAWIDGFERVGGWSLGVIAVLALLAWATDYVAALLGAKKVGASRWALIGAALGTVLGLFMGLVGVLFMPFVGAVAGELYALRHQPGALQGGTTSQALKVGTATWIGIIVGTAVKIALVFVMVGVFVVAYLWR
ncbi:MAG TPA: DUF456 domain-containing protein [Methylibium sp.]|uniref:DUF456 domain-containing protein n=1 Tax=Methylibium sp. TaxID=2067992 RepID=UPI002DB80D3F|nr:DUF456 domain-containing protein [Methylibium sp.]HEU4460522.1 DUF456 domain-containing protein [Methylibium sp.]